ncbi:MAG: glycosyltransferase family 2 protein [Thermoanaerobaculia bacterium]|nr:glycosyltransferase family 2 protein [Thermoanaerobaculia bacterium]
MIRVVIVNYGAGKLLADAVASVAGLAEAGHEVRVVDNASPDGSLEGLEHRFPWLDILRLEENVGFGAACNRGAQGATGRAVLFLNPDAAVEADTAGRLEAALADRPRLGAVAPALRYPDGRRQFSWEPTPGIVGETLRKLRNPFEATAWAQALLPRLARLWGDPGWLSGACLCVRREAFEAIGGFDESFFLYFEDADLCLRLRAAGWKVAVVPDAHAIHDKGRGGTSSASEVPYRRAQFLFYRRHRSERSSRLLLRRLRRKFARIEDGDRRARLLGLCDEAERALG